MHQCSMHFLSVSVGLLIAFSICTCSTLFLSRRLTWREQDEDDGKGQASSLW